MLTQENQKLVTLHTFHGRQHERIQAKKIKYLINYISIVSSLGINLLISANAIKYADPAIMNNIM